MIINFARRCRSKLKYMVLKTELGSFFFRKVVYSQGEQARYCSVCGSFSLNPFLDYHIPPVPPIELPPVPDWSCPVCGSHPRFR